MDNQYTRKEKICPLANDYCNREDKDCNVCISKEDNYQLKENAKY